MQHYVAGFLFSPNREYVAMVLKNTPSWQAGKLNAIGGKVENLESPDAAMWREFKEETGQEIPEWRRFCVLNGKYGAMSSGTPYTVHFYVAFGDPFACKRVNDVGEKIIIVPVDVIGKHRVEVNCQYPWIANIPWLMHMALAIEDDAAKELYINEVYDA